MHCFPHSLLLFAHSTLCKCEEKCKAWKGNHFSIDQSLFFDFRKVICILEKAWQRRWKRLNFWLIFGFNEKSVEKFSSFEEEYNFAWC